MKDFRIDPNKETDYILKVKKVEGMPQKPGEEGVYTYTITLADGRVFKNIKCDEKNLKTIIDCQEKQAAKGVKNIGVFKKKKTIAAKIMRASGLSSTIAALALGSLNPIIAISTFGAINLLGTIPAACSFVKNKRKVEELEKIATRNSNYARLKEYTKYPNALTGLSGSKKRYFSKMATPGQDPFGILKLDKFSEEDMNIILANMATEDGFAFNYPEDVKVKTKVK